MAETETVAEDIWEEIDKSVDSCSLAHCGFCTFECPMYKEFGFESYTSRGKKLLIRSLRERRNADILNLSEFSPDELEKEFFACTLCGYCDFICAPSSDSQSAVTNTQIFEEVRAFLVNNGIFPEIDKELCTSIKNNSTPWPDSSRSEKERLAKELINLGMKKAHKGVQTLFYVGCTTACFARHKSYNLGTIAKSTAQILSQVDKNIGVLGKEEMCCGSILKRTGFVSASNSPPYSFEECMKKNLEIFKNHGIQEIITACPGCAKTFAEDYKEEMKDNNIKVVHMVEKLTELLEENLISFGELPEPLTVTFHDPCHLVRHLARFRHMEDSGEEPEKIVEEPRKILKEIPNIEIIEVPIYHGYRSHCCGSGGGLNSAFRVNASHVGKRRAAELEDCLRKGSHENKAIVTACPFCNIMLKDALVNLGSEKKVYDIAEIMEKAFSNGKMYPGTRKL